MKSVKTIPQITFLFISVVSVFFYSSCAPEKSDFDSIISEFSSRLENDVQTDDVGSIAFGIFQDGDVVHSNAFGIIDRDTSEPARPDHIYRTGSISKSITAVLMMMLAQDGLLNIDDPVSKFLPEIENIQNTRGNIPDITLSQLASHTSGLIREPNLEDAASGPIESWEDKVLASIKKTRFQADPGDEYSYSNIGYGILGLALSRAAGVPFMDLVEERIFQTLGMNSSTFVLDDRLQPRLASGYDYENGVVDGTVPLLEHAGRGYKVPNGGVYSTIDDLANFSRIMTGEEFHLLSEDQRKSMMSIKTPESETEGYGLGFSLSKHEAGFWWVSHGGSVAGYNAFLLFQPDSQLSIVLLRNYSGGVTNLGMVARELGDKLLSIR